MIELELLAGALAIPLALYACDRVDHFITRGEFDGDTDRYVAHVAQVIAGAFTLFLLGLYLGLCVVTGHWLCGSGS